MSASGKTDDYQSPLKQWWNLSTSDRRPKTESSRLVSVTDLPIYGEECKKAPLYFIEEEPLPLQREFSTIRRAWQEEYGRVAERFSLVDRVISGAQNGAGKVQRYLEEEWSVLPKAGAITLGGMAGLVLGMRRGAFGRIFSSATGMATMTAFCYPQETVDLIRSGLTSARSEWNDFQKSPLPPHEKKPDLSPPKK